MPTATQPSYRIEQADWSKDGRAVRLVREAVFIDELGGDLQREWEHQDASATHLLARTLDAERAPIGVVRFAASGQISRLAVIEAWRRQGVGSALLASAVRMIGSLRRVTAWLDTEAAQVDFFRARGFAEEPAAGEPAAAADTRMRLTTPEALMRADLGSRVLGETSGRLFLEGSELVAQAVGQLARQARRRIDLLSADLQPALYDQPAFLLAVRHLAIELRGRLPVRVLVIDPEPAIRRGHQLIELSRALSTDIQIRAVPQDWAEHCDQFLLCDQDGHCVTRFKDPRRTLVDFNAGAETRRLRRLFDQIWDQGEIHQGLRRLYL